MIIYAHFKHLVVFLIACAMAGSAAVAGSAPVYSVTARGLTLQLDGQGQITGGTVGEGKLPLVVAGDSALDGFATVGTVAVRKRGGGREFVRRLEDSQKRACTVTDRFTPTKTSIRWEMEVVSDAAQPWTTPLELRLKTVTKSSTRFWTAWVNGVLWDAANTSIKQGDLAPKIPDGNDWGDPLVPMPWMNRTWDYGNGKGTICIPIASALEPESDNGLSLALSPEQPLLWAQLSSSPDGTIRFRHSLLRLGGGKRVKFAADIVAHEADWRGGMRWMVGRYPDYFNPQNPKADEMAGCGAYSHHQGELDTLRLKQMAFRLNWISSFEWPFFGMYLPPVPEWKSAGHDNGGNSVPALVKTVSWQSMNDYCRSMKEQGFFALNYFNLTEFGSNLRPPGTIRKELPEKDWWTDATTYLYRTMPDSVLLDSGGHASSTWSGAVALDCGDAQAQMHLIEQARRNVEKLPDSAGISIDRMDWLTRVNYAPGADDGLGWYEGRCGRFMGLSWLDALSKIGPIMHNKGRVIFANPCIVGHRVDWFREVDGIYDEYGDNGYSLNGSSLIALRKSAVMWTHDANSLKPDPDSYFQRHLYLGAFPTVPFPGNDHTILPEPKVEQHYLDYGPLLDVMRGKKWVLEPHCVESATPGVKVNLFQVPGGYALPVTFGGTAESAIVRLRNLKDLKKLKCQALQPGASGPTPVPVALKDGVLELTVPLRRGCAMVRVFKL